MPIISLTAEQAAEYFPPSFVDGDVCTLKGYSYEMRAGKRVVIRCEAGKEKPFKLELRV